MKSFLKLFLLTLYCAFVGIFSSYLYNNSVFFGHTKVISASRFDIVDDEGINVGAFGSFDGVTNEGKSVSTTGVVVFDEHGNTRFVSGVNNIENWPFLALSDSNEQVKLLMHLDEGHYPKILLSKSDHDPQLILSVDESGAGVNVYDSSGVGRVSIFEYLNNSGIEIFDKNGEQYWLKSSAELKK